MAVAVGQRCVARIKVIDIELRNARDIKATIKSPQGEEECLDVSFDEVSGVVYVSVDVNSVGSWAMWLRVRFDKELFYTPAFVFAEVEGDAKPCDALYIVDVEVQGESVSVTPPKIDVDAITREEFEQLSKDVAGKVDKVEGKGLSTNDFTNEYKQKVDEAFERQDTDNNYTDADKALVQTIPNLATKNEVNTVQKSTTEAIKGVRTELEAKANTDGYYPSMSVGMADNLVGRGDTQDAHINFRPSAGADNITDHAARVERIKGNSVVYNQLVNTDSISVELVAKRTYFTDINGEQSVRIISATTTIEAQSGRDKVVDLTQMFGAGNEPATVEEYLQRKPMNIEDEFAYNEGELIDMKADSLVSVGDNAWDEEWENGTFNTTTGANIDAIKKQIRSKNLIKVLPNTNYTCTIPAKIAHDNIWCMLLDKDKKVITGYTAPSTIKSGNSFGLTYYKPTFTTPSNAAYLKFYCVAIYGDVYTNDICIHLEQSGYKNGKYYPYQQEVKDLSFIGEAFPEGMRSAGSAFDEIRFNPTKKVWEKIVRVGVRAYAEGDAEDSSVTTDGKTTNYPLDNPTPTTIDLSPNFNLDYLVWDFGTEEAIVPNNVPSAPFRADIQYGDNFVDDIRKNKEDIATNKANIAKNTLTLTSKQDTLTLTTKPNGNIVIGNLAGQSKEFMPATPSGDPMHDAYVAAGAVWNATTSKWKLNGGEFTNGDIRLAYWRGNQRLYPSANLEILLSFPLKVNFPAQEALFNSTSKAISLGNCGVNNSVLERVKFTTATLAVYVSNFTFAFYTCQNLISIDNVLNVSNATGLNAKTFYNCKKLEHLLLEGLNTSLPIEASPLLSKESLLFMINNCASNVSFTISLHPDVYAKCTRVDEGEGQYIGEWWDEIDDALGYAEEGKNTKITLASA